MKKFKIMSLCIISLIFVIYGCSKKEIEIQQEEFGWDININDVKILDSLNYLEELILYTGEKQEIEHNYVPINEEDKLILLNITVEKRNSVQNAVPFELNNLRLSNSENSINNSENVDLKKFGFDQFTQLPISFGMQTGYILYEVDESFLVNNELYFDYNQLKIDLVEAQESNFSNTNIEKKYDIITEQNTIQKNLLQAYNQGNYDFENPFIIQDPYNMAPLTALVLFNSTEKIDNIVVEIEGKDNIEDNISYTVTNEDSMKAIPIYWLYENYENKVTISLMKNDEIIKKKELLIETADSNLEYLDIKIENPSNEKFLMYVNAQTDMVIDQNGNIRWYSSLFSENGEFFEQDDHFFIEYNNSMIYEQNYLGKVFNKYEGSKFHHDFTKNNKDELFILSKDSVIIYDSKTNKIIDNIDYNIILDNTRKAVVDKWQYSDDDWLHMNAVVYDEVNNSIITSNRNQSTVISYNLASKDINWILGDHSNFSEDLQSKLLTPIGENFEWQWAQHAPQLLPDLDNNNNETVDLIVFDNGNYKSFDENNIILGKDNYSRAVWYRINQNNKTVEQIWEYGKNRGSELYSNVVGDVDYYQGNVLINFGSLYKDKDGVAVDLVSGVNDGSRSVKIIEIPLGEENFNFEITIEDSLNSHFGAYRAEKLNVLELDTTNLLGSPQTFEINLKEKIKSKFSMRDAQENQSEQIRYSVDNILLYPEKDTLSIEGWSLIENLNSNDTTKELVFRNNKSSIDYVIKLNSIYRSDVTQAFNDLVDYNQSGFKCEVSLNSLPIGEYSIGLKLSSNNEELYYDTGYYFNRVTADESALEVYQENNFLSNQNKITSEIENDFEQGNYNMDNPLIIQDPFNISPLTALIMFKTTEVGQVSIQVNGKDIDSSITHEFNNKTNVHTAPVFGLYPNFKNEVKISFINDKNEVQQKTYEITTKPLPDDMPNVNIQKINKKEMSEGFTFISTIYLSAFDNNGDIRWYISDKNFGGNVTPIKRLSNGNLLVMSNRDIRPPYYKESLYEIDLLGRVYNEYIVDGIHHDYQELANGNLIIAAEKEGDTIEDYIVELDRKTGKIIREWDISKILPVENIADKTYKQLNYNDKKLMMPEEDEDTINQIAEDVSKTDWFHNNSLYYSESEQAMIVSGRHQDIVMKFDVNTNEIIWILSDNNDEWPEELKSKLLKPIGDDFEFQYGQHATTQLPNGDIMVYDNGNFRSKDIESSLTVQDNYSRAVIYRIDEQNMTVEQVWQYGKERGSELFTPYIGDVDYLQENHYLINFGGIITDSEGNRYESPNYLFAPNSEVKGVARIIEVKNNEVIYEAEIAGGWNANTYRAERLSLYSNQDTYFDFSRGPSRIGMLKNNEKLQIENE